VVLDLAADGITQAATVIVDVTERDAIHIVHCPEALSPPSR
jgi:hypothetical protein